MVDEKAPRKGITELRYIDPKFIKKVRVVEKGQKGKGKGGGKGKGNRNRGGGALVGELVPNENKAAKAEVCKRDMWI